MKFLTDHKGKTSHTRVLVMLCVPPIVLLPLIVWALVCLHSRAVVEIPLTITGYIGAANAILLGYAGVKGHQETKASGANS